MTGIDDLFREYSEPDEFVSQYQLELWGWQVRTIRRERMQRWRATHRESVREKQRAYMAERYRTDMEFRRAKLEQQRQYDARPDVRAAKLAYQRARYAAKRAV